MALLNANSVSASLNFALYCAQIFAEFNLR